jgi:hypothetical protein
MLVAAERFRLTMSKKPAARSISIDSAGTVAACSAASAAVLIGGERAWTLALRDAESGRIDRGRSIGTASEDMAGPPGNASSRAGRERDQAR